MFSRCFLQGFFAHMSNVSISFVSILSLLGCPLPAKDCGEWRAVQNCLLPSCSQSCSKVRGKYALLEECWFSFQQLKEC